MKHLHSSFKKRVRLKSTFQKLVISNIIIILLILIFSSQIMYSGYKNQMVDQSGAVSQKLLNQGEYYSDYMLRWARSYIYQLYLDQDIYKLMFIHNYDKADAGLNKLKQATMIQPSIQSVYIFNNATRMVYPSDGSPDYFTSYDNNIEDLLKASNETMSTKFIPRKIVKTVNGTKYEKNVMTLLLRDVNASFSNLPYGAIILNLDAKSVQDYFKNISEKDYDIFAIDNDGKIILHSDSNLFLTDISNKDYIKTILESDKLNGSFTTTIEDRPSIVSYKTSKTLGMKFISIIPYNSLTSSINSMLFNLVASSVLLFIVGIILSIFLLKKVYSPVDRTFKTLRNYLAKNNPEFGVQVNEKSRGEEDYISQIVNIIVNQPLPSSGLLNSDLNFIKKILITGLLFNTNIEIGSLKSKLKELDVNIDFGNIVVLLFKIDLNNLSEVERTKEECENLKNLLYTEGQMAIEGDFRNELVVTEDSEFAIIINVEEADQQQKEKLLNLLKNYQNDMHNNHSVNITVAIGDYVSDFSDTAKSFKSAREYMNYTLKYGIKAILCKSIVEEGKSDSYKYDETIEESFLKELKAGNIQKVQQELDEVFGMIGKMSYNNMVLSISRFLDSTKKVFGNMLQTRKNDNRTNLEDIMNNVEKFQTLDEKKCYLFNLCNDIISEMKEKRKNRKNEVVENIINYINQNSENAELTPDSIADSMKLSANYIRVLFKDSEGKSISSYINEVRFEKARTLLETTDLTVVEISEKVGIANHNYFYTAFKKFYGVSPNNYRNSIKE